MFIDDFYTYIQSMKPWGENKPQHHKRRSNMGETAINWGMKYFCPSGTQ